MKEGATDTAYEAIFTPLHLFELNLFIFIFTLATIFIIVTLLRLESANKAFTSETPRSRSFDLPESRQKIRPEGI
jgi:hypothetical protein